MEKRPQKASNPSMSAFYSTEYSTQYSRPHTMSFSRTFDQNSAKRANPSFVSANKTTGFCENSNESAFFPPGYPSAHQETRNAYRKQEPKGLVGLSAMERSGYWNDSTGGILYKTPAQRRASEKAENEAARFITDHTLKKMRAYDPISAENGGIGPKWGSTTQQMAYPKYENNNQRFWNINRSLIGKKESNSYTRKHLSIPNHSIVDGTTTNQDAFRSRPVSCHPRIPQNCVVETSGFASSQVPTVSRTCQLSDISPSQLHPTEVSRLRKKNTTEYQNLYYPNPYMSVSAVSFQNKPRDRCVTTSAVRRGVSGYCRNESMTVGTPGNARTFRTGTTEAMDSFKNPELGFRGSTPKLANIVERSGFWC